MRECPSIISFCRIPFFAWAGGVVQEQSRHIPTKRWHPYTWCDTRQQVQQSDVCTLFFTTGSLSKQPATLETQTQTYLLQGCDSQKLRLRLRFRVAGCLLKLANISSVILFFCVDDGCRIQELFGPHSNKTF